MTPTRRRRWPRAARAGLAATLAVAGLATAACDSPSTNTTSFPIPVNVDTGAVLAQLTSDGDDPPLFVSIDTLSPLTVVDYVARGQAPREPRRRRHTLTLYGQVADGDGGVAPVAQARFPDADTFELHPCRATVTPETEPCSIGTEAVNQPLFAILGADVLAQGAIRFAFGQPSVTFFPDISGDNQARANLCEAVFRRPYFGGGTLLVGGAEVGFPGRRIATSACLGAELNLDPDTELPDRGAVDALFVVATGAPLSLVSRDFYDRYQRYCADSACTVSGLGGPETIHLPSGPITVERATIDGLTLVSEASDERGPCQELYANAYMLREGDCGPDTATPCPCSEDSDDSFCRTGAAVTLTRSFDVGVIADSAPLLQALRDELRPELPELDGLLAPNALTPLVLDVDYPNNRVIMRCAGIAPECATRPALISRASRDNAQSVCLP
ncbi:MAG: hypothetical protein Tsb0020_52840 [Haliangiales bacterium]